MPNGNPREVICQKAEELHIDLLILGCRGLSAIKKYVIITCRSLNIFRMVLGSVSDYCTKNVQCAVTVVH
jgi:nucleotide-binding universal stress UspA family protein